MSKFVLTAQLQLQAPTNTAQVVRQIQSQLQGVKVDLQLRNAQKAETEIRGLSDSLEKADKSASKLGGTLRASIRRFTALAIATRAVSLFTNTLGKAIESAIDFERELIKVAQVTGKAIGELRGLTNEINRLSTSLGVSSQSILSVGRILSQAGLDARETQVALSALAKTELAPTFDDITQTAEGAVAIFNQFKQGAASLESQLGSLNAVAGQFAVESGDLISVIRRTGGVFKQAGGDLNELIALFTSVRSTTRESAESIATGLRTIFTRIQRPETIKYLEQFGVKLLDLEGKFIGPYRAIGELNKALAGLEEGDITFIQIAEELGGFRQIGKVLPLIKEYAVAQEALKVAQEGSNSLAADAATAQASLAIRIVKVKEEFLALIRSISETRTFQIIANGALGLASAFLKVAEAVKPLIPLIGALAGIKLAKGLAGMFGGFLGGGGKLSGFNKGGKVNAFATGGLVPGTGNSDTVPAMLTPGEFVIRKSSVQKIGSSNLQAMNKGGRVKFARAGKVKAPSEYELTEDVGQLAAYEGSLAKVGNTESTTNTTLENIAKKNPKSDAAYYINSEKADPKQPVKVSGSVNNMLLGEDSKKGFASSKWLDKGLSSIDKDINKSLNKLDLPASSSSLKDDEAVRQKVDGFALESFISGLLGKAAEGGKEAFDFKGDFSNTLGDQLTRQGMPPKYLDAKRTLIGSAGIVKKGIDDKEVNVIEKFSTGGLVQKFKDGGIAQRKVGYIDYDVIANPANEAVVTKGMKQTGVKGIRLYADYLTDLATRARKDSSIGKLSAIYGVAGSGKTTLARGQGTDKATLRETERFPILTPEDIQKSTEVIVLSSSVSKKKLDEVFQPADRTYTLSSTTEADKSRVASQRASRDTTGVGLEGRKPGTTTNVESDTAIGEALLSDRLGDKSVVLGRTEDGRVRRKSKDELVEIIKKKIGFTWGGFSPMTAGHESIMDAAAAAGIPAKDFIYLVGSNEAIKNSDPSSYRTAIFDQDARVLLGKAGAGSRGATVLAKDKGFEVPQAFDVGTQGGRRQVVVPAKGSTVFAADKDEKSLSKYRDAGYEVSNIERTGGISGTQVRDLIMSGNMGQLQKVLSPNVYELISNNIKQIRNRANVLPEIIAEVKKRETTSLAEVESQIKSLGISRVDNKKVESDPEYAAQVDVLKELRKKRDKIKSFASFEPYSILAKMAEAEPEQYGLDFSMPRSSAKPMRQMGKKTQKANLGGFIKRLMSGGIVQRFIDGGWVERMKKQSPEDAESALKMLNASLEMFAIGQRKVPNQTFDPAQPWEDIGAREVKQRIVAVKEYLKEKKLEARKKFASRKGAGLKRTDKYNEQEMLDAITLYQAGSGPFTTSLASGKKTFKDRDETYQTSDVRDRLLAASQFDIPKNTYSGLGRSQLKKILKDTGITAQKLASKTSESLKALVGKRINFPTFLSTSVSKSVAESFVQNPGALLNIDGSAASQKTIDVIKAKNKTKVSAKAAKSSRRLSGLDKISDKKIANYDDEKEFIIPPNTHFQIIKATGNVDEFFPKALKNKPTEEDKFIEFFMDENDDDFEKTRLDLKAKMLSGGGEVQKFATGGIVPGTGNRDTVPATLQAGDFVIRKRSVESIGAGNLQQMAGYATGGNVDKSVPALLTPGEYVFPKEQAQKIGYSKLNKMNKQGKYALGGEVQKFATGGQAKDFGKIGFRSSANEIRATYIADGNRSGSVTAVGYGPSLYTVSSSSATKGYGPKLYDVVMELATANGSMLTSDRNSVSKDAQRVWEYYFKNRNDVTKQPLDPSLWTKNQSLIPPELYGDKETWPPKTNPAWVLQSGYKKPQRITTDPSRAINLNDPDNLEKLKASKSVQKKQLGGIIQKFNDGGVAEEEEFANIPIALRKKLAVGPTDDDKRMSLRNYQAQQELERKRGMQKKGPELDQTFGLAALFGVSDDDLEDGILPETGAVVKIQRGVLNEKRAKVYERYMLKGFNKLATTLSKRFTKDIRSKPFSQSEMDEASKKAGFYNAVGAIFEAALALTGAPYAGKDSGKSAINQSIDFPSGLGSASENFGLPSDIPTDATRTSGSRGKSRQDFLGQVERYLYKKGELQKPIKRAAGGIVPGTGNRDTVPATLQSGDFVIRKSSVNSIGAGNLQKMAGYNSGGKTTDVPALLTPGEFVFSRKQAQSIGYGKLNRMNKVGKYAKGGVVQRFTGGSSGTGVKQKQLPFIEEDNTSNTGSAQKQFNQTIEESTTAVQEHTKQVEQSADKTSKNTDQVSKNTKASKEGFSTTQKVFAGMTSVAFAMGQLRPNIDATSGAFTTGAAAFVDALTQLSAQAGTASIALEKMGVRLDSTNLSNLFTGEGKTNINLGRLAGRQAGKVATGLGFDPATARAFGKNIAGAVTKLTPFIAGLTATVAVTGLLNSALTTFYNYQQRLNKAIQEGNVEKAGDLAAGQASLESANTLRTAGAGIGSVVGTLIAPGIGTAIGAVIGGIGGTLINSLASVASYIPFVGKMFRLAGDRARALAEAEAGNVKVGKLLETSTAAANKEMEKFKNGLATAADVVKAFGPTFEATSQNLDRSKAFDAESESGFLTGKSGTVGGFARGFARVSTLGLAGLAGLESGAQRNERLDKQAKLSGEAKVSAQRAVSQADPAIMAFSRQVIAAGGDFEQVRQSLINMKDENGKAIDVGKNYLATLEKLDGASEDFRQKIENMAQEVAKAKAALEAMTLGFTGVNGAANATALSLNNYLNAQNAGYSGLSNSLSTLEASVTSAAQGISSEDFEASLGNASNVLAKFGATDKEIQKFEDNMRGVNAAQKSLPDAFKEARSRLKAEVARGVSGQTSSKAQTEAIQSALVDNLQGLNISEDVKKSLTAQINNIKFEDAELEAIQAGNFDILEKKLQEIGGKQLEQVKNAIQKEIEIQQKINETVQKRLDLEDKYVQAQQRSVDIMMEMREGIAKFGGAGYTPEQRSADIVQSYNIQAEQAGITGLQEGSPAELNRTTKEITSELNRIANVRLAAGGAEAGVNGQKFTPEQQAAARQEMEGESGVNLEKQQARLNGMLEKQYSTTKALIDQKIKELNLIKEKNKLEKSAMDDLIAGDMEAFFDKMAAQGAQAAIATGDERLMGLYGGQALGMAAQENRRLQEAGVTELYGQKLAGPDGLTERGFQAVADRAGIADPTFAQAAAGTTVEEAAAEKEIRELYSTLEPLAKAMEKSASNDLEVGKQIEAAAKQLGGAATVLHNAAVKLGGDPNAQPQQAGGGAASSAGGAGGGGASSAGSAGGAANAGQAAVNQANVNAQTAVINVNNAEVSGGGGGLVSGALSAAASNPASTAQVVNQVVKRLPSIVKAAQPAAQQIGSFFGRQAGNFGRFATTQGQNIASTASNAARNLTQGYKYGNIANAMFPQGPTDQLVKARVQSTRAGRLGAGARGVVEATKRTVGRQAGNVGRFASTSSNTARNLTQGYKYGNIANAMFPQSPTNQLVKAGVQSTRAGRLGAGARGVVEATKRTVGRQAGNVGRFATGVAQQTGSFVSRQAGNVGRTARNLTQGYKYGNIANAMFPQGPTNQLVKAGVQSTRAGRLGAGARGVVEATKRTTGKIAPRVTSFARGVGTVGKNVLKGLGPVASIADLGLGAYKGATSDSNVRAARDEEGNIIGPGLVADKVLDKQSATEKGIVGALTGSATVGGSVTGGLLGLQQGGTADVTLGGFEAIGRGAAIGGTFAGPAGAAVGAAVGGGAEVYKNVRQLSIEQEEARQSSAKAQKAEYKLQSDRRDSLDNIREQTDSNISTTNFESLRGVEQNRAMEDARLTAELRKAQEIKQSGGTIEDFRATTGKSKEEFDAIYGEASVDDIIKQNQARLNENRATRAKERKDASGFLGFGKISDAENVDSEQYQAGVEERANLFEKQFAINQEEARKRREEVAIQQQAAPESVAQQVTAKQPAIATNENVSKGIHNLEKLEKQSQKRQVQQYKQEESTSKQTKGAIPAASESVYRKEQAQQSGQPSVGIDPELLNKFSSALEKFNSDFSANIDRLENTKFKIELAPTNINVNLTGGSFLENMKDNIKQELLAEVARRMQNQGFNPDGSPRSTNGSQLG